MTSYLQILFVKELLVVLTEYIEEDYEVEETINHLYERFNIDFNLVQPSEGEELTFDDMSHSIMNFLYFLMDMHMSAKSKIKSPQSKLIDFINRVKIRYEFNEDRGLPYSFEGLMLLIGKDRKKIYDRFL